MLILKKSRMAARMKMKFLRFRKRSFHPQISPMFAD